MLLVFVAINEELKALKKTLKQKDKKSKNSNIYNLNGYSIEVVMTSMGMKKALQAAEKSIDANIHRGVFVLGYCGGLSYDIKNSDIIVPNKSISSVDQFTYEVESDLTSELGKIIISEGLKYKVVPMITESQVIEKPSEKVALFKKSHAQAVDMETSEILRVAHSRGVKACAMKVVIDDCTTELPHFNGVFNKTGEIDHLSIASVMASSPGLSMNLSSNMKHAQNVINAVLPAIILRLCSWWDISKV
jgi:nucleoside phosphorylase